VVVRLLCLTIRRFWLRWIRDNINPMYPELGRIIIQLRYLDDDIDKRTNAGLKKVPQKVHPAATGSEA
jgi:hypothetical protein